MTKPFNRPNRRLIRPRQISRNDLFQRKRLPGQAAIIPLRRRPRDHRLHAPRLPAITVSAGFIQEIMPPFTTDPMTPFPDLAIHYQSPADTSPHNDAKHHPGPGRFPADDPPLRFRQSKTIGIIGQHDRDTQAMLRSSARGFPFKMTVLQFFIVRREGSRMPGVPNPIASGFNPDRRSISPTRRAI